MQGYSIMKSNDTFKVPRRGYLYVICGAVLWAITGSSSKFLFNSGVTPFQLVQLRTTISAALLFLIFFFTKPELLKISPKDIVYFIVLGTVGMAAVQFTYFFAISKIHVAAAILLEYMAPILIALHAVIYARDRLSMTTVTAIAVAVIGCYFVVGAYNLDLLSMNRLGILSGLGAAVSFAWYSVHGEYGMRRYDPWTVLFYALLFAAVAWNILHPPLGAFFKDYSPVAWGWIFFIATMGTIVPFACYFHGVNLIRSTRASITAILEPISAGLFSYIFLNETMEALQLFGGVLVIGAIVLLQIRQEHDEKAPAIIRTRNQDGI
jgi:drug/metabolite transporter (DMT)-like permease